MCIVSDVKKFARTTIARYLLAHGEEDYPEALIAGLRELGVFGASIPREYGGRDLGPRDIAYIMYELARGWQPLAGLVGTHGKLCREVLRHGTPHQKSWLLPPMARGELICARAYHERGSNDPELLESRIEYRGGTGVLRGHKDWVTNARNADRIIAIARGGTITQAVVVDPSRPGIRIGDELPRPGMRGVSLAAVDFAGYEFDPERDVLGGPECDVTGSARGHDMTGYATRALGSADATHAWLREFVRHSLGKFPPEVQGAIRLRVGEVSTQVSVMRAVWRDLMSSPPGISADEAKIFCSATLQKVISAASALCGGAGYAGEDATLTRHYRDALALQIIGAPNDALLSRVGTRAIMEE
ncbi:MAG TPA: acyl-CoA dehydrogenase family protein [Pseudonocardiaceae bacterium]|nr:acyl-CoA dehydrogenase family protein [Pseudonocardiaceae bacterium]